MSQVHKSNGAAREKGTEKNAANETPGRKGEDRKETSFELSR